ncbi:titin-like isoform X2 [Armigeres subalbatus]|uniref:titin-like isoform X2 n=1 Tax=Armigeres subalbatus TaxID=124917 RepID=UPI002ED4F257
MISHFALLAIGALVTRAEPIPDPDPARVLGKYVFAYQPSENDYNVRNRPLDFTHIDDNDDYDTDASSSSHSYGPSSPGSSSPGFMTSYTSSIKHGTPLGNFDSESEEDHDEREKYVKSNSGYYNKKSIIPILQSYSIIHAKEPPATITRNTHNSDDEDEDYGHRYRPPKIIHTRAKAIPISQHIEVEKPVPIPYVKKIHVPVPKGVKVHIPHPVLVPVPQPYPVHVPVSQPVAVPVIKEITIPIEKIVPYPVEKRVPVPIEKPVPYPVEKHVPVHIPQPYPVKVPVVKTIVHKHKPPRTVGVGSVTI